MKPVILIGCGFDPLVGDTRIIASEVMSLRSGNYVVVHLVPSRAEHLAYEQAILKSDSTKTVHKYVKIPLKYIHYVVKRLCREHNSALIIVASRNTTLVKEVLRASCRGILILLIDNLRYVDSKMIYRCTGSSSEIFRSILGKLYYNALYSLNSLSLAVSKRCKTALLLKDKVLALPPCYVEIYPENHKVDINHEAIRQKLQFIRDAKTKGYTIVLHAKVFGPRSGKPPRVWYRTLGFYSFISFYIMTRCLRDCLFVVWDAAPQLFEFYLKSLNLSKLLDNMVYLPLIPQEYINELYKLVDIVTIPRLGWHGYGITTSLIEALYFGKPVITTSNVLENLELDRLQHEGLIAEDNIYAWPRILRHIVAKYDLKYLGNINRRKIYNKMFSLQGRTTRLKQLLEGLP